ncbi:hypothetical protein UF64_01370 [Thalassospira sp. HJ]|nr:hypothetical protein UF64_01370 [Thalassospira sp. HJ]
MLEHCEDTDLIATSEGRATIWHPAFKQSELSGQPPRPLMVRVAQRVRHGASNTFFSPVVPDIFDET